MFVQITADDVIHIDVKHGRPNLTGILRHKLFMNSMLKFMTVGPTPPPPTKAITKGLTSCHNGWSSESVK